MAALMTLIPSVLFAQNVKVTGRVTDPSGQAVIGASVLVQGTKTGMVTDLDGQYAITVASDATLEISAVGYLTAVQQVGGKSEINIVLKEDISVLEDAVVVGYGVQKKGSLSGAIVAVNSDKIIKTKSENPQNMLTGKLPGLRVWQQSAEPGSYSNSMDIRGFGSALVIIDGVPRDMADFQRLNAQDIDNVSVLKDATAAIYGVRGGNGVILVTTKAGAEGKVKVSYDGSFTFQTAAKMPYMSDPLGTMRVFEEDRSADEAFSEATRFDPEIESYLKGDYTGTNWNKAILANWAPQHQHSVSINGGTEKFQFYTSFGYLAQDSIIESGDVNYDKFNIRANITAKILEGLKFNLNLDGMSDHKELPGVSGAWGTMEIFKYLWRAVPMQDLWADAEHTKLSGERGGALGLKNVYGVSHKEFSGFRKASTKRLNTAATLDFDFGTYVNALQGLKAKAMLSYDFSMIDTKAYATQYELYSHDADGNVVPISGGTQNVSGKTGNSLTRNYDNAKRYLGQFTLAYDRTFAEDHKIGALLGWEIQRRKNDNFGIMGALGMKMPFLSAISDTNGDSYSSYTPTTDIAYESFFGRLNYTFREKYILEGQFRYDGSSKFHPDNRWGFFPSVSGAWRVSEEPFFKNSPLKFINQFKLRASYGELGDDSGINYEWMSGYVWPQPGKEGASLNGYAQNFAPGTIIDGKFEPAAEPMIMKNEKLTWAKSKTFDVGFDIEAWQGKLGITFDYFVRNRDGLIGSNASAYPTILGVGAPKANMNTDRNKGIELQLSHRNRVGDFTYGVTAMMSVARHEYINWGVASAYANSYEKWRYSNNDHRFSGINWGIESDGRYGSWQDIWDSKVQVGSGSLPGDFKYKDWNGDGKVDGNDYHPIGTSEMPLMNFSLNLEGTWKNLDFSVLLQGSALSTVTYHNNLYEIKSDGYGGVLKQFLDRSYPISDEAHPNPFDQTLKWHIGYYGYGRTTPDEYSDLNQVNGAYLRVKSIEVGYTLPKINALKDMSLRVYANAYNPFTFTKVKFIDPEHPSGTTQIGYNDKNVESWMYPLHRNYTIGIQLSF